MTRSYVVSLRWRLSFYDLVKMFCRDRENLRTNMLDKDCVMCISLVVSYISECIYLEKTLSIKRSSLDIFDKLIAQVAGSHVTKNSQ